MGRPEVTTEGQQLLLDESDSLREVAERIGCSRQLVSYWRNGKRLPSSDKMMALEEAYGIPMFAWSLAPNPDATGDLSAELEQVAAPRVETERDLPSTLAHTDELLFEVRTQRRKGGLAPRERAKLIDQEGKLIAIKARLEREQELLEDRVVRRHPVWIRARRLLVAALKPHPEAARDVIDALEQAGL